MVKSYSDYLQKKNAKQLTTLNKFIEDKNISRQMMVLFLKKEGEKVLTKESIDDIVSRLNDFDIKYVQKELP